MDLPAIFQRLPPDDAHVQEELQELLQHKLLPTNSLQSEPPVHSHDWAAESQSKATLWSFCAPLREAWASTTPAFWSAYCTNIIVSKISAAKPR
jgi:hypothetical protein